MGILNCCQCSLRSCFLCSLYFGFIGFGLDCCRVGFYIRANVVNDLCGFGQCFAVVIDSFSQVTQRFIVCSYNFFQTQSAKAVSFNICLCSFFSGFDAIIISHNDFIAIFKTVEFLCVFDCCKSCLLSGFFGSFSLSGQISKTLVVFCCDFFQAQPTKLILFNIFFGSFFDRFDTISIGNDDFIAFFKAIKFLSVFCNG